MTRYGGMGRTRPKKLTPKAAIPIIREDDIDIVDDDPQSSLQQVETGVEKAEESEIHLQKAISASAKGKVNEAHIPTPETVLSNLRYDELYPPVFSQPATYVRFSSTVEDCCGCPYNMTDEDDIFLKLLNVRLGDSMQCSEDEFEEVMNFFEETAQTHQPFAAVDSPPVLSFPEMQQSMDAAVEEGVKRFAKHVYDHWKSRRIQTGNQPLQSGLKFETGQDTDDTDPYVCFRRREVRQVRKTRGRDAQSTEKLRRLRKELEDARQLVAFVRQREMARKEMLAIERQVFLQRSEVKDMKRKLGVKDDDDEDLINQKPKKRPVDLSAMQRPSAPQLRLPQKPGIQGAEDLQSLEDVQAEKENEILHEIKHNIAKHVDWNEGYVDFTKAPLSPSPEPAHQLAFRPAITTQLPTPPSSDSSEHMLDSALDTTNAISSRDKLAYPMEKNGHTGRIPSFRRRVGRGGRLMIDRRDLAARKADSYAPPANMDPWKADRYKFDNEDSDEESPFDRSKYDTHIMLHRALMVAKAREHAVAAQAHAQAQAAQAQQRRLQTDQGTANNGPPTNPGPGASTAATET